MLRFLTFRTLKIGTRKILGPGQPWGPVHNEQTRPEGQYMRTKLAGRASINDTVSCTNWPKGEYIRTKLENRNLTSKLEIEARNRNSNSKLALETPIWKPNSKREIESPNTCTRFRSFDFWFRFRVSISSFDFKLSSFDFDFGSHVGPVHRK